MFSPCHVPKPYWALSQLHQCNNMIPGLGDHCGGTLHMKCVCWPVFSWQVIKCLAESKGMGARLESTFPCFVHRNYQEHFHSNTSELFDFEDSCKVNGLLQGSLQALLPNVHHREDA